MSKNNPGANANQSALAGNINNQTTSIRERRTHSIAGYATQNNTVTSPMSNGSNMNQPQLRTNGSNKFKIQNQSLF